MGLNVNRHMFEGTIWTLCGLSALFLASRFAVRIQKKGRLRKSDHFLIIAVPSLLIGAGLLQSSLDELYAYWPTPISKNSRHPSQHSSDGPGLTLAIEMLWVAIYSVKASFFAQFKFHKPPYAYVSPRLTRYYWIAISLCGAAFVLTLIVSARNAATSGSLTFWLVIEAAVAVIAASISSYRIVVLDYLAKLKLRQNANPAQPKSRPLLDR